MNSMRIALVLTSGPGALGRHVGRMAKRFVAEGHEVELYCLPATARGHQYRDLTGVRVRTLMEMGHLRHADVVHAHGYQATLQAVAATLGRVPLVSSWHQSASAPEAGPAVRLAQTGAAKAADLVLGASQDVVAEARALGAEAEFGPIGAPPPPRPGRTREEVRADMALAENEKLIVSVGRLTRGKNFDLVVDMATELADRRDLRFVILGGGPERTRLLRRIVEPALPVALPGTRGKVADLLAAADVVLITSRWEARPILAQMALQVGVPLVATRVGGIPELVGDGAVLIDPDAPASAAFALAGLLDDPARGAELVAAGRARAATWPTEDDVAAQLLGVYRRVIDEQTSGDEEHTETRGRDATESGPRR